MDLLGQKLEIIKELATWFNKRLTEQQIDIWASQIDGITLEALRSIADTVIAHGRYFPTPGEIREMFREWILSNPDKIERRHEAYCQTCKGVGVYEYCYKDSEGCHFRMAICECSNGNRWAKMYPKWPRFTKEHLQRKGYFVGSIGLFASLHPKEAIDEISF